MTSHLLRKVWRTPRAGSFARLQEVEESLPPLNPKQIRIQTRAIGLNFADLFAITGLYSATPSGSFIPGLEFSGDILEVGQETKGFAVGEKVMGVTRFGGYATLLDIDPLYIFPLPQGWNYGQGAAFLAQTFTAWYALKTLGNLQPEQNVLIQSAAGGVGIQAMKICKKLGAHPFGVVGSPHKIAFLKEKGFSQVILRDKNFKKNAKALLMDKELHLVLEAVGGKIQKECYQLLAPTGRMIIYGSAQFTPGKRRPHYLKALWQFLTRPLYDPLWMISENKSIMAFNLIWLWDKVESLHRELKELMALELEPPHVGHSFPFEKAREAVEILRQGNTIGKVILTVEPGGAHL